MSDIDYKLRGILAEKLGVDDEKLTPTARLVEDLGADSLDTIEVILEIDKSFGITFEDEELENVRTVGDLDTLIKSKRK